jgi:hypothetical protein
MFPLTTLLPASTSWHALSKTNEVRGKPCPTMTSSASEFNEPDVFPSNPAETQALVPEAMWGRMAVFATVLSTVFLSANALVCATWSHFFGVAGWGFWQAVPGALIVSFIGTTILGFRYSNPLLRAVYTLSATWLAALNYAFFASLACWFVDGLARLAGWPVPRFDIAAVLFGIALLTTA